jgi:hypothetical protein
MTLKNKPLRNVTNVPKVEMATRLLKLALNRSVLAHVSRDAMLEFYEVARDNLVCFEELVEHAQKAKKGALQPAASAPGIYEAEEVRAAALKAGNTPMPFGKFEGYPLSAVFRHDQACLHSVLGRHSETHPELCEDIRTFLKAHL